MFDTGVERSMVLGPLESLSHSTFPGPGDRVPVVHLQLVKGFVQGAAAYIHTYRSSVWKAIIDLFEICGCENRRARRM